MNHNPKELNTQLAWVAGFFEGEGNFGPNKKKGRYLCPVVQIAQVGREPLDYVQKVMGLGKVKGPYGPYKSNKQAYYVYMAYGQDALLFVDRVLPYLFNKGEQVKRTLKDYDFKRT